jgi:hypothetical protein
MLQKVRAFKLDCELEEKRRRKDKSLRKRERLGRVRDAVAKRFGKSGRTLADWLPILDAPLAVQAAVEDKRLSREQAMRILAASADEQAKIATDLAARKTTAKVLKQHLGRHKRKPLTHDKLTRRWRDLFRTLRDLYQRRADCFAVLLPKQRGGAELLVEFAEFAKEYLATAKKDARGEKKTKLKLVLRNHMSSGKPSSGPKSAKPKLVLRREVATA